MASAPAIAKETGAPFTDYDRAVIESVEPSLAKGLAAKKWWERRDPTDGYFERLGIATSTNPDEEAVGYLDQVPIGGEAQPVMGVVQRMLFDRPKSARPDGVRDQIREFVLRYFMRVSDFRLPQAAAAPSNPPEFLKPFQWGRSGEPAEVGFGYSQLYYKLKDTGRIGKFSPQERFAIVDLRELGVKYEWIVVKVRIFNFNLKFHPFGPESIEVQIPLREESLLALSADFITNQDDPEPGVLGRYGFGYAVLPNPPGPSLLAFGPGHFDFGFQTIDFEVDATGAATIRMSFAVNQPRRIVNLPLDPLDLAVRAADSFSMGIVSKLTGPFRKGFESIASFLPAGATELSFDPVLTYISLANLFTGGLASAELSISKEELEREFLVQHFNQHYEMATGALLTYRQIPSWLDAANLPLWVINGIAV